MARRYNAHTSLVMSEDMSAEIDALASASGLKRAEIIRRALTYGLPRVTKAIDKSLLVGQDVA